MKNSRIPAILFSSVITVTLIFTACSLTRNNGSENTEGSSSSSPASEETSILTPNVSYTGVLEKMDASIMMQGSHKLTLDDGQMIVLESSDANLVLDTYIGKRVEVQGSVRPTVEAGGTMMRISEIIVLDEPDSSESSAVSVIISTSSSSVSSLTKKMCGGIAAFPCNAGDVCIDDPSDSCDPQNGEADCSGICMTVLGSSSSVSSKSKTSSSVASSKLSSSAQSSAPTASSSSVASVPDAAMEEQIKQMVKQSYDQSSLWTQKYCTSHIAFCIPVHKNWYFKSFGATTSNAWHVEFGFTPIDTLGQAPIVLNLVSGNSSTMNATSGQVKTQGSEVIGYKDWNDGDHFEIIADVRLKAAVEHMITNISAYELAQ